MPKNIGLVMFLLAAWCFISYVTVEAAGLTTTFSEVKLENLQAGKTYSAKESAGLALVVVNTGEEAVDLKMELLLPQPSELKEGFAPIPDLSWIKLEKTEFKGIPPNKSAVSDVIISIPDDKQHQGKKYQVFIWSHTLGRRVGVGLKSKLLFTIITPEEDN